jgi:hypothetical protein
VRGSKGSRIGRTARSKGGRGRTQEIEEGIVVTPEPEAGTTGAGTASADAEGPVAPRDRRALGRLGPSSRFRGRIRALMRWELVLPVIGAFLAAARCLVAAGQTGFPEDDGWIHQDFARTLATTGHFAFQPGGSGAGSTSPLWVLFQVPIHLATHGHAPAWLAVTWAALVGTCALAGLGVLSGIAAATVARRNWASPRVVQSVAGLAGLAVVGEWHLIWAAVSGMETDLFAFLALLLIVLASRGARPIWLGLVAGATIAARPEGALVVLLVALAAAWQAIQRGPAIPDQAHGGPPQAWAPGAAGRLVNWLRCWALPFSAAALVCVLPYLALNVMASGRLLPSTFYAKQAGMPPVSEVLENLRGFVVQLGVVLVVVNPVLLALVGLYATYWLHRLVFAGRHAGGSLPGRPQRSRPSRSHVELAPLSPSARHLPPMAPTSTARAADYPLATLLWLWPLVLAASYAARLPGAWQYGRYLMPTLPPLLALGVAGLASLLGRGRRFLALAGGVVGLAVLLSAGMARRWAVTQARGTLATSSWGRNAGNGQVQSCAGGRLSCQRRRKARRPATRQRTAAPTRAAPATAAAVAARPVARASSGAMAGSMSCVSG